MKAIYAVINRKGGTGKTTTAHALGAGLSDRGYKVLFIDLDAQANLTDVTGAEQTAKNIYKVLTGDIQLEDAIQHTAAGFDIVPATYDLITAERQIRKAGALKEALQSCKRKYDYIVIDTAPTVSVLTAEALSVATEAVIVAQTDLFSLNGISEVSATIEEAKRANRQLHTAGILLTRFNSRTVIGRDIADSLSEYALSIGTKLFDTRIRECTAIKESQTMRQSIFEYSPRCNAAVDYRHFIDELIKERK